MNGCAHDTGTSELSTASMPVHGCHHVHRFPTDAYAHDVKRHEVRICGSAPTVSIYIPVRLESMGGIGKIDGFTTPRIYDDLERVKLKECTCVRARWNRFMNWGWVAIEYCRNYGLRKHKRNGCV